jgi:F-type H+-transporting ATPase subunit gamma
MASTRALKTRIRSVKNTKQITKAMQMVAASKMRKAQEADKASAAYTQAANEILTYLAGQGVTRNHPLFEARDVKNRLLIVIAADKGLAGAYNSNVMKLYVSTLRENDVKHAQDQTIAIGRRAAQFFTRIKETNVLGAYEDLPDQPSGNELKAIVDTVIEKFTSGDVDAVDVVYTKFVNSIVQTPTKIRVLPAGYTETEVSDEIREATYEPSLDAVLEGATRRLIAAQIFQALLDAKASEWSMRMLAMKNATDNASDVIDDLTLEMNKARQAAITQELAEISGGVEAMNN